MDRKTLFAHSVSYSKFQKRKIDRTWRETERPKIEWENESGMSLNICFDGHHFCIARMCIQLISHFICVYWTLFLVEIESSSSFVSNFFSCTHLALRFISFHLSWIFIIFWFSYWLYISILYHIYGFFKKPSSSCAHYAYALNAIPYFENFFGLVWFDGCQLIGWKSI